MIAHETNEYIIREIPLNYRIDIKKTMRLKNPNSAIERDWYSPSDWDKPFKTPLERAIWVAECALENFRPITEKELQENKIRADRLSTRI